jgi:hypothetical protein
LANHRSPRNVGTLAGAVALTAGILTAAQLQAVPVGQQLAAYVYGVGGAGDRAGANIPHKLTGALIRDADGVYRPLGADDTYVPIVYSASIPVDPSVKAAMPTLDDAVKDTPAGEQAVVVGYSEGAIAAELLRRQYQTDANAPAKDDLSFLILAGPMIPNGGIYARFPNGIIPGFTSTGPTEPSRYDTTYVMVEYDPVSDFPAYFNPLAIANSVVAFRYSHGDASYDAADLNTGGAITTQVTNAEDGTDTYVLIPVQHLQLLEPIRDVAEATGTTAFVEPLLGAVEPALRVMVDMGYTDRENSKPEVAVPFSLVTPAWKWRQAAAAVPGALEEGAANFEAGVQQFGGAHETTPSTGDLDSASVSSASVRTQRSRTAVDRNVMRPTLRKKDDSASSPAAGSGGGGHVAKSVDRVTEKAATSTRVKSADATKPRKVASDDAA